MKVILLENVRKIGSIGEIINVKRGFARNYLISTKKALFASKENIKEVEKIKPEIKLLQELLNSNNKDLQELLCSIPNVPNELVKKGSDENDNEIVYVSSGEGSTSEGEFHEALNWASREKLPIIFHIQDNE